MGDDTDAQYDTDIRCHCGNLLARWHADGIELKCKRCRRLVVVPFSQVEGAPPMIPQL